MLPELYIIQFQDQIKIRLKFTQQIAMDAQLTKLFNFADGFFS